MDNLNPQDYINSIQKQKHFASLGPIILVIITFIINHFYRVDEVKYIALFGLIWYIFNFVIFKISLPIPPEKTADFVFSPICGKVKKIEKNKIIISKKFWHPVDVRNVNSNQNIEIIFEGKQPHFFEDFSADVGKLIGYKSGELNCEILLPADFKISVSVSQKVISGFSVLGTKEK
ncbi:hypothetical protein ACFLYJ_00500 [Candidatus Cloacimonadota bacterium]